MRAQGFVECCTGCLIALQVVSLAACFDEKGGDCEGEGCEPAIDGGGPGVVVPNEGGRVGPEGGPVDDPVIADFDVPLEQGAFWEFQWSSQKSSYGASSGGSSGMYRVELGAPVSVEGKMAYPLIVTGHAGNFAPEWTHLAFEDGVLYGSTDGYTLETIVDTHAGLWIGGGFFIRLSGRVVMKAREGSFSNGFLSATGVVVEFSSSTDDTVCVDGICVSGGQGDSLTMRRELFQDGVGPVGFYFQFTFTQGYTDQYTTIDQVGLVASSLRGDTGVLGGEGEPGGELEGARPLAIETPTTTR